MDIKIKGQESIGNLADSLKDRTDIYKKGLKLQMWRALSLIEAAIAIEIRKKFKQRTGNLMNSINKSVEEDDDVVIGIISNSAVYASIHEFGGLIQPKRANYLRFPTENNTKPDGSPEVPANAIVKPVLLPLKSGDGYLIVSKADNLPKFLLKKSVNIPPRPYMIPAMEKTRARIFQKFNLFLTSTFDVKG